jgi:hypothetical protein
VTAEDAKRLKDLERENATPTRLSVDAGPEKAAPSVPTYVVVPKTLIGHRSAHWGQATDPADAVRVAHAADRAGVHSVWSADFCNRSSLTRAAALPQ